MKPRHNMDIYALTWRLPVLVWQTLFFIAPLVFMIAMSFFLVKNYRMVEAFELVNWMKMFSRDYFWDSYVLSLGLAALATICATALAFPASYALAFMVSDNIRRWAIFFLIIPYFTSYLVRIFSWYVLLAEAGIANGVLGYLGLGPFTMLNTAFATIVGYMALTLPLVVILQTLSMANIDRSLIEAAHNLGAGRLRTIVSVVVPAGKVGLIVGALFCFILSFGDFVSPYYLGGSKPPTLTILITDTTKSGQQWPRAAVVAVTMMATLMVIAYSAIRYAYNRRQP
ncbi:MAG: ABC transporter permease [Gammaproteobacteria bacterium]|nr:ABC transporter permease [Gammaproteobacteria bacterium]MXY65629.1 ABC transporter permease [Gammaproteobacteria bacterium]MYG66831.1 ABC transporter permease [Gammaproteobacteria bacterium]